MQSQKHLAVINGTLPIEEEIKQKKEEYKQRQKEWQLIKHECECGGSYSNSNKSQHMKSSRHLKYLNK